MITLNNDWDLSATLHQEDTNNEKITQAITGRFSIANATPTKIYTLMLALNDLTTNTYTKTTLKASNLLDDIIGDDDDDDD